MDVLTDCHIPEMPTFHPIHYPDQSQILLPEADKGVNLVNEICSETSGIEAEFRYSTIKDYYDAYRTGRKTPLDVAQALITALQDAEHLRIIVEWNRDIILEQATGLSIFTLENSLSVLLMIQVFPICAIIESTERIKNNQARSVLEGIPISVKDQILVEKFVTGPGYSDGIVAQGISFLPRGNLEIVVTINQ
jgi:hypothetical protein